MMSSRRWMAINFGNPLLFFNLLISFNSIAVSGFVPTRGSSSTNNFSWLSASRSRLQSSELFLFKLFEESGPLGKGITVGKVQVALNSRDRSSNSIFSVLERMANENAGTSSPLRLARLTNDVCLGLLRRSDEWLSACSSSQWFGQNDAGKAESLFNDLANREAAKFEKEYIPGPGSNAKLGGPTVVVVSLVLEIRGDTTKFDGAGFSMAGTREVLSSIASDCLVERGECVNAVEIFWTPSDPEEVLTNRDLIIDFPELIDL